MIEFLLNSEQTQVALERADVTVLQYLREQRELVGTKEGCASGDCGACTAVVAEPQDGKLVYKNINTCITFLGSIHGKQLITVEHLKSGETLHPVQQAMVDCHGSQCGFCTPGFVMSLFALCKSSENAICETPEHAQIEEFLAGNLCRCTGYKPIIQAAQLALSTHNNDHFSNLQDATLNQLKAIDRSNSSHRKAFFAPDTIDELCELITDNPEARLLAGGTDLALETTQQLKQIDSIIYLGGVQSLRKIDFQTNVIEIGAAVTLDELDQSLPDEYQAVSDLLKRFGSKQVRNTGTIGGNIANASPVGDLPPVLLALAAELILQSKRGIRKILIDDFFLDYKKTALAPDEIIRSLVLPRISQTQAFKVYKISKRIEDDISAVCLACLIQLDGGKVKNIRIACGGMAAIPKRATACETFLNGSQWDENIVRDAQEIIKKDFQPIDDVRASAQYRLQVTANLLERLFLETSETVFPTRIPV